MAGTSQIQVATVEAALDMLLGMAGLMAAAVAAALFK